VPGGTNTLTGRVLDGAGDPVPDAVVETWQAEGWGRAHTDEQGRWAIRVAPATHVDVSVFARGLLNRVVTRLEPTGDHDIHLQGDHETVFFAL
jgi:protocatechuate 3,4-dioxygenase alpha subunit